MDMGGGGDGDGVSPRPQPTKDTFAYESHEKTEGVITVNHAYDNAVFTLHDEHTVLGPDNSVYIHSQDTTMNPVDGNTVYPRHEELTTPTPHDNVNPVCDSIKYPHSEYTTGSLDNTIDRHTQAESPMKDFDDVLSHLGVGKWNLISLVGLGYWYFLMPGQILGGSFLAPDVEHICHPPELDNKPGNQLNNYTDSISVSKCQYNIILSSGFNETQTCKRWDYDNSTFGTTVTSEFNLVCSSSYLRMSYSSIYMLGALVGAPCNGISDRYGRKVVLSVGTIIFCVMCIISSWLPNVELLLVTRFILGFMYPASTLSGYNLVLEAFGKEWRSVVGVAIWLPWVLGTISWGGIAYLIRDWRTLQLAVSLPTILFLPFLWYMDESPRWLVVAGHQTKAKKVLERAARLNHVQPLTHDQLADVMDIVRCQQNMSSEKNCEKTTSSLLSYCQKLSSSALILFRTPKIRMLTLVNWHNSFIASMTFFGLSLSGVSYSNDPYLYMVLSGLAELPSVTLVVPIIRRWGRRPPSVAFFFTSGVALLLLPFVSQGWQLITLAMIGKLSISMAFNVFILYATELYPTEVRLQGAGAGLMMSRLGSTFSPFITDLLGPLVPWAPSVVFGVGSLMSGAAILLLPESQGRSMPDTIHDFEHYDLKDQQHHNKREHSKTKRDIDT